ncbi:MAG: DUF4032 domain-containing protein [Bacteroidota bacterium]|nr:DUF4032 domain-containing protein [Bacteroidota bacterium]
MESAIRFHVDLIFEKEIERLPWHIPLAEWEEHGVRTLEIKRGISRHVVIFVKSGRFSFGIKEIGEKISKKEISHYEQLLLRGIHTLVPVGYVVREEEPIPLQTPIGVQYEENNTSHTITLLVEKVIPDSVLYRRGFSTENRERIWDAVAALLAELHSKGVYWGDASLANTLIRFENINVPFVGRRTELKAYLADAETIEFQPEISESLREAELNFFFESMDWINGDLRAAGVPRDELSTEEDKEYLRHRYHQLFGLEQKKRSFELQTSYNIDRFMGSIADPSYADLLLKHIEEHKWYVSELAHKEISLSDAAHDWYENIFVPLCAMFRSEGVLEYFPGKTAAEMYVEIMTNKYFLSEKSGKDVGMERTMRDYMKRFGAAPTFAGVLKSASRKMKTILDGKK